jgi:Holliday junction resolvase-like predicted endonuclease
LDIDSAMKSLQQLISSVPFAKDSKEYMHEERYRYLLKLAFYIIGCKVEEEKQMAKGQIDLVAYYDNCILVMELKMDTNGGLEAAKKQLEDRKYVSAFAAEKKAIYAIAISFSSKDRSIENWAIEK